MQVIQIYSVASTYVSSIKEIPINKCNEYLEIGNYREEGCNYNNAQMITQFDFGCINSNSVDIKKVYLNLTVPYWNAMLLKNEYEFQVNINLEPFDKQWVNWQMKPESKYYKTVKVSKYSLENKEISIDITDLVEMWNNNDIENYGITIESKEVDFVVYIGTDCSKAGPRCTFYCEEKKGQCNSINILELQVREKQMNLIEDKGRVKFDKELIRKGEEITYDENNAEIIINAKGLYRVGWWISIDGTGDIKEMNFSMYDNNCKEVASCSIPVFVLSQIYGQGVFEVLEVPYKISLQNHSGADIQYANVTIQADLIVTKL